MKTNGYIYKFSAPNIRPNQTFQISLPMVMVKDTDQNAHDILNNIIQDARRSFKNRFGFEIQESEISLEFIALVDVHES